MCFTDQDSHIINVEPLEDWSDGVHHVIISQDLPLMVSQTLGDINDGTDVEWSFSTAIQDDSYGISETGMYVNGADPYNLRVVDGWIVTVLEKKIMLDLYHRSQQALDWSEVLDLIAAHCTLTATVSWLDGVEKSAGLLLRKQ